MTTERTDGPTPAGGEYAVATYVELATLNEVDKARADGIVVAEFDGDDKMILETVGGFDPHRAVALD